MKIRLLEDHASRFVTGPKGAVLEIDDAHGRSLVAYGVAEFAGDAAVTPAKPKAKAAKGTRKGKGKSAASEES